jgi:predicted Zn-ribbon and HTH transcriptional regulator
MGKTSNAKCLDCGHEFELSQGGGFTSHLLRCDSCGITKAVGFDEVGDLHLRYIKGLPGSYSIATSEIDSDIQKYARVVPISETEYHEDVEAFAGNCECGVNFTFDAPPRCPKCHSTRIEEGETMILYD